MSMNIGLSAVRLDQTRTDLQTLAWQAGNGNASLPGETFTTGAGKTYFDGSGILQTAGANTPRLEKDPATGLWGRLVEPVARTNIISQNSGGIGGWSAVNGSLTASAASHNGITFVRFTETSSNGVAFLPFGAGVIDGSYAFSCYLKVDDNTTGTFNFILWDNVLGSRLSIPMTISSGGVITAGTASVGVKVLFEALPNGIYRISGSASSYLLATNGGAAWPVVNSSLSGAKTILIGYPQLEPNSLAATSVIPTNGASVTLDADVLTVPVSGNVTNAAGFAAMSFTPITTLGTANETLLSTFDGAVGGIPLRNFTNGVAVFDGTANRQFAVGSLTVGTRTAWAATWAGVLCNGAAAGVVGSAQTFDGSMDFGANLRIGENISTTVSPICLRLHSLTLGTRRLTNSELSVITA